jgi:octaprenyl-diphosphate synthase
VKQTGGIEYTQQKMVEYRDEALTILNTFENIPVKNALEELVRFTTDRKF